MQLSSLPQSVIWEIFKIKNSILQFWSPGHGREKKKRRRTQAIAKRYAYHSNAKSILFNEII